MTTCLRSCDMNAIGDAANPLARFMVNLHIVLNSCYMKAIILFN